jgi:MFS family permease
MSQPAPDGPSTDGNANPSNPNPDGTANPDGNVEGEKRRSGEGEGAGGGGSGADGAGGADGADGAGRSSHDEKRTSDGKIIITEADVYDKLGFRYPWWKKWLIISVIFFVQVSMNWNASFYAGVVPLLEKPFGIDQQAGRVGQMIFLIAYAFGSELWAPWSEEIGRWPIMQLSLLFVNIWQIPCALAPNFGTIVVCRALGGLSSAGGSVTLGMVADMWEPDEQQFAVAFIVLSSVAGSVFAPIAGGPVNEYLSWHWNFWIQLIIGGAAQYCHFWVPETRCSILLKREAKRRRKLGENVWSPEELKPRHFSLKPILIVWARPFVMFVREPIVLWLSLLSGFSDALIFTFLQSYKPVYKQWGFGSVRIGLAFVP